jgi:putative oxygen-independent coproporphyrinogen III oxidase
MSGRSLSFYVHIPYCLKRCGYCDFNTYTPAELGQNALAKSDISSRYMAAARGEVVRAKRSVGERRRVETVFFGGGTPSLMEPRDIGSMIEAISEDFDLAGDCEITMEANPDTVDERNLKGFIDSGVNRFSFGVQSAKKKVLQTLDRTHDQRNVVRALETAHGFGIEDLSIDLIYGTPNESISDLEESLDLAFTLPINHISAYALIVEEGTRLAREIATGQIPAPDDDEMARKYLMIDERLTARGFDWYELSNWAKPGGESLHNQVYWREGEWWGIGPGAHSSIANRRWSNIKSPIRYMEAIKNGEEIEASSERLSDANRSDERIMLKIRLRDGLRRQELSAEQSVIVERYISTGAIDPVSWREDLLVLTVEGRLIADRIVRDLVTA